MRGPAVPRVGPRGRGKPRRPGAAVAAGACAVAFALVLVLAACGRGGAGGEGEKRDESETARSNSSPSDKAPETRHLFTEIARAAGVEFRLENGARGKHYLVETAVGGVGWIDHDGDGDMDLYVANGHSNPREAGAPGETRNRLFRNDGRGRFEDVTEETGGGDRRYSNGVAVGDVDGDGRSDLLVTNYGRNTLYRNRGTVFEDITERAGLDAEGWNMSAVFFDHDRDGDLDLYVARYLDYDPESSRPCLERGKSVYCHPRFFPGEADLLYENLGDGKFQDISREAGIARAGTSEGKGLGVIALDFDRDGWTDIYVANDTTPNFLWRNRGDGTFEDLAFEQGVATDDSGRSQAGMGVDRGDVDGDGLLDIHVTNYAAETNNLYLAHAARGYRDGVQEARLGPSFTSLGFGTVLEDLDLDGDLDLAVANGHVDDRVEGYRQAPHVYLNDGGGRFRLLDASEAGPIAGERLVGRGLASADIDGDGDIDLALATIDRGVLLLRNETSPRNRWLGLRLRGTRSHRDAYGARVEARVGERTHVFEVQSARSYLSACDPRVTIGLGSAARVDEVAVRWPRGLTERFGPFTAGREVTIVEGEGRELAEDASRESR